jgi:hypothetical protein
MTIDSGYRVGSEEAVQVIVELWFDLVAVHQSSSLQPLNVFAA